MRNNKLDFWGLILLSCVMFTLIFSNSSFAYLKWKVFQDDSGKYTSPWGMTGSHGAVLCKIFKLEIDPGQIKKAFIKYEMASGPYYSASMISIRKPEQAEGLKMPDMIIMVNDTIVAQESPLKLAMKGWHKIKVDPKLLKKGDNKIGFTWARIPKDNPEGISNVYCYMGIDTTVNHQRSCSSTDGGKTFSFDTLRPGYEPNEKWQGEYMVRLHIALEG